MTTTLNGLEVSESKPPASVEAARAREAGASPTIVIEARPETVPARLRALWRYRSFYGFLFKEIVMRRARGTLLGFWWVILRPLIPAIGFIVAFSTVAPLNTGQDVPYAVFFLSGFITWRAFQGTLTVVPRAFRWTQSIVRRTYFPRLLVPLAAIGPVVIELAMLCVVLVISIVISIRPDGSLPVHLGWQMLWVVPCVAGALLFALAFGIVLSIVTLFFRDVIFSVPWIAQLAMLATPVLYPIAIPDGYRWLYYALNPMAQMVLVSRWALTGQGEFEPLFLALAFGTVALLLTAAVAFFLRAETHLGDQL